MSNRARSSSRRSSSSSEDRSSRGSSRGGRSSSRGSSRGESKGRSGGRGKNAFSRIGSLTVSKSCSEKDDNAVIDLQDSGYQVWGQIYLPEGTDLIKLKHEDKILITFKEVEGAPDFVVGTMSIEN